MKTRIAYVLMIAMAMIAPVAWAAPVKKAKTLNEGLTNIVDKYTAIQELLTDDPVAKLPAAAKDLSTAAKETARLKGASKDLQTLLGKVDTLAGTIGGKDVKLDDARATFKDLSAAVVELVDKYVPEKDASAYSVYYCPMAKAKWVQKGDKTKNPYYGKKMQTCGTKEMKVDMKDKGDMKDMKGMKM
jgi:hypothetical protein